MTAFMPDDKKKSQRDGRYGVYGSPRPMQQSDFPLFPQTLRLTDPTLRRIVMRNPRLMVTDPPYSNDSRYGPSVIPKDLGPDFEEAAEKDITDKKKSLDMFNSAWSVVKNDGDGMEDACENCGRPIENYYDYANKDHTPKRGFGNNPGIPSLCKRCAK